MSDTQTTEKFFGGETALAAHRRIDVMQLEITELRRKVDAIPGETRAMLVSAFAQHEEREKEWRIDPDEFADKLEKRVWAIFIGNDLASSADAEKYKRTLQDVWRGMIKVSPYIFNAKMFVFTLFVAAIMLTSATAVMQAIKSRLGLP